MPFGTSSLSELADIASRQSTLSLVQSQPSSALNLHSLITTPKHPLPWPLEFEKDDHRYRTLSKLKNLEAEIQEHEREDNLVCIYHGLRPGDASSPDCSRMSWSPGARTSHPWSSGPSPYALKDLDWLGKGGISEC
ncbi:hypothetical protein DFH11DRAFT_1549159 [Phellopilus nigrolimitatus]|nr:hypothetical protein DFH11DRAFT_1549159 [Phellopilus nigrolimitatus]